MSLEIVNDYKLPDYLQPNADPVYLGKNRDEVCLEYAVFYNNTKNRSCWVRGWLCTLNVVNWTAMPFVIALTCTAFGLSSLGAVAVGLSCTAVIIAGFAVSIFLQIASTKYYNHVVKEKVDVGIRFLAILLLEKQKYLKEREECIRKNAAVFENGVINLVNEYLKGPSLDMQPSQNQNSSPEYVYLNAKKINIIPNCLMNAESNEKRSEYIKAYENRSESLERKRTLIIIAAWISIIAGLGLTIFAITAIAVFSAAPMAIIVLGGFAVALAGTTISIASPIIFSNWERYESRLEDSLHKIVWNEIKNKY